jgi:hypothetical protein
MNNRFGLLWLLWIVVFLAIELTAAANHKTGDTLSEWVWHVCTAHPVVYFPFAGFLVWLVLHFLTKGKVGSW